MKTNVDVIYACRSACSFECFICLHSSRFPVTDVEPLTLAPDTITHWWSPMYHNTSPDNIEYCPCYLNIYSWTLNTNHLIMNDKLSFQVHISQLVIKTQTVMMIFPPILTTPLPLLTFNIDSQFELYCLKQIFLKLFQELFKKSSVTCINLSSWGLYWI